MPRLALLLPLTLGVAACDGPRGGDIVEDLLTGERREILAVGRCRDMGMAADPRDAGARDADARDADARCYRYVGSDAAAPREQVAPLAELESRRWDRIN